MVGSGDEDEVVVSGRSARGGGGAALDEGRGGGAGIRGAVLFALGWLLALGLALFLFDAVGKAWALGIQFIQ